MAQQTISLGAVANDGTGDPLRDALDKANDNFGELYQGRFAAGVSLASAGTTDLGAQTSPFVTVTGTTTITSLGTVAAGVARFVRFSGALTLTHNGTSLILPGAADIATVAGDTATFLSEGSGNWRALSYMRAAYSPPGGAWATWSPTVSATTPAGSGFTATIEQARYEKVGRTVNVQGRILVTNLGSGPAASGDITVTMPFTAGAGAAILGFANAVSGKGLRGRLDSASTILTLRHTDNSNSIALNERYWFGGSYEASS